MKKIGSVAEVVRFENCVFICLQAEALSENLINCFSDTKPKIGFVP